MIEHDEDRDEVLRALAPMREGPVALGGRAHEEAALRSRVLETLRAEVAEVPARARKRRQQRVIARVAGVSCALAAAAAAAVAFMPREREAQASVPPVVAPVMSAVRVEAIDSEGAATASPEWIDAFGDHHALSASAQNGLLPAGTLELRSNDAAPRLRTAQGVELKLSKKARLRVKSARAEEGAELRLLDGEVACAVPKLGATRQFAIDAPGVRVIVHGTRFSVRARGAQTCVRVTEGLVAVHPEASDAEVKRLGPGESWGCEPQTAAVDTPRAAKPRARVTRAAVSEVASDPESTNTGTLDAENRLLADALRAERTNDRVRAHRLFAELLAKHPSSLLAADAARGLERTRAQ